MNGQNGLYPNRPKPAVEGTTPLSQIALTPPKKRPNSRPDALQQNKIGKLIPTMYLLVRYMCVITRLRDPIPATPKSLALMVQVPIKSGLWTST